MDIVKVKTHEEKNERIIISVENENKKHITIMPEKNNKKIFIFSAVVVIVSILIIGLVYWAVSVVNEFTIGIIVAIAWLIVIMFPFFIGLKSQLNEKEEIIISSDNIEIIKGEKHQIFKVEELQNIEVNDSNLRFNVFEAYKNIYIYDRGRIVFSFANNKTPLHFGKCINEEDINNILQFL